MATLTETQSLVIKRRFDASPERLYAAWTDPNLATRWLFTGPHSDAHETRMDVRVGGRWTIKDVRGGVEYVATGEFLELDPPSRLVMTFGMPQFSPDVCRLIVEIAAAGTGSVLTLTQTPTPANEIGPARDGWGKMLAGLARQLTGGGYGEKLDAHSLRFERLFPVPIERLWAYLTDPELRGRWFASGPMELKVGGRLAFSFHHAALSPVHVDPPARYAAIKDGASFEGRVTACEPPRLLAFLWGGDDADEARFELTAEGAKTRLVLTHTRLKTAADMANVAAGWHTHLAILADRAAGKDPAPFWAMWRGVEEDYAKRLAAG